MKIILSLLICSALSLLTLPSGQAATQGTIFTGSGWTLTLVPVNSSLGSQFTGSFVSSKHHYAVEGDWIPAADEGGDLLRFYGHPFGPPTLHGLVGTATLHNTCNPNCVSSNNYILQAIAPFPTLPGSSAKSMILKRHSAMS